MQSRSKIDFPKYDSYTKIYIRFTDEGETAVEKTKSSGAGPARKQVLRIVLALVLTAVCAAAAAALSFRSYTVAVVADGKSVQVSTNDRDPAAIVEQAGVKVRPHDYIDRSRFKAGRDSDDGNKLTVYRAFPVKVKVDGETKEAQIAKGTVNDVLDQVEVSLGDSDVVSPAADQAVTPDTTVEVTRVRYQKREEPVSVPHETVVMDTSQLPAGQSKVEQKGRDGTKNKIYRDKIVNGEVVDTEVIGEQLVVQPIKQVIIRGTQFIRNLTAQNIPQFSSRVLTGRATAYTAKPGALTATGVPASYGRVAVDPKKIPYGTKMFIVAEDGTVYGYAVAADTGGFVDIGNADIDLYFPTEAQCHQWGKKNVSIYILAWGNGSLS